MMQIQEISRGSLSTGIIYKNSQHHRAQSQSQRGLWKANRLSHLNRQLSLPTCAYGLAIEESRKNQETTAPCPLALGRHWQTVQSSGSLIESREHPLFPQKWRPNKQLRGSHPPLQPSPPSCFPPACPTTLHRYNRRTTRRWPIRGATESLVGYSTVRPWNKWCLQILIVSLAPTPDIFEVIYIIVRSPLAGCKMEFLNFCLWRKHFPWSSFPCM